MVLQCRDPPLRGTLVSGGAAKGPSPVGERRIREAVVRGPYGVHLGIELAVLEADRAVVRLPWRAELGNGAGIYHGGATASLIDTAATAAAWTSPSVVEATRGATVGFTVNFLSPGLKGRGLSAEAVVLRRGGSLTVVDVLVTDDDERKIARGVVTYKLGGGGASGTAFD